MSPVLISVIAWIVAIILAFVAAKLVGTFIKPASDKETGFKKMIRPLLMVVGAILGFILGMVLATKMAEAFASGAEESVA